MSRSLFSGLGPVNKHKGRRFTLGSNYSVPKSHKTTNEIMVVDVVSHGPCPVRH